MTWSKALTEAELPAGERRVVKVGDQEVLLLWHEAHLYAIGYKCPHLGAPLKRGEVKDGAMVCPLHHSTFDLATGAVRAWCPWPPGVGKVLGVLVTEKPLPVFATKVEAGEIWVDVPE